MVQPAAKVLDGGTCGQTPLVTSAAGEHAAVLHRLFRPQQVTSAATRCVAGALETLHWGLAYAHVDVCVCLRASPEDWQQ